MEVLIEFPLNIDATKNSLEQKKQMSAERIKTALSRSRCLNPFFEKHEDERTYIPWEVLPLIDAFINGLLHAEDMENIQKNKSGDQITNPLTDAQWDRHFLNRYLHDLYANAQKHNYFGCHLLNDPAFQYLYTNLICTQPLTERMALLLTLSQKGPPSQRPGMMFDCIVGLEYLLDTLLEKYFPFKPGSDVGLDPLELISVQTGDDKVLFEALLNKLLKLRQERHLKLHDAKTADGHIITAYRVKEALLSFRVSGPGANSEEAKKNRVKAEETLDAWLLAQFSEMERESAGDFAEKIQGLKSYLNQDKYLPSSPDGPVEVGTERLQTSAQTESGFESEAFIRYQENIYLSIQSHVQKLLSFRFEQSSDELQLDFSPIESFAYMSLDRAKIQLTEILQPYIELTVAFQGVISVIDPFLNQVNMLGEMDSALQTNQALLAGTELIAKAAIARIKNMQVVLDVNFYFLSVSDETRDSYTDDRIERDASSLMDIAEWKQVLGPNHANSPLSAEASLSLFSGIKTYLTSLFDKQNLLSDVSTEALNGIRAFFLVYQNTTEATAYRLAAHYCYQLEQRWHIHGTQRHQLRNSIEHKDLILNLETLAQETMDLPVIKANQSKKSPRNH